MEPFIFPRNLVIQRRPHQNVYVINEYIKPPIFTRYNANIIGLKYFPFTLE